MTRFLFGMSSETFLRLCSLAPRMEIASGSEMAREQLRGVLKGKSAITHSAAGFLPFPALGSLLRQLIRAANWPTLQGDGPPTQRGEDAPVFPRAGRPRGAARRAWAAPFAARGNPRALQRQRRMCRPAGHE